MLGVSGEDATRAAGVRYFANGGFTDGSKEKLDNLIDFSKAYGKYALRSNGIRTTGDALSMLWTVANNSMSGDASLALAATSLAADVAPLLLNKYLGSDSPVTTALTEAAKNYNGGTVLSSWQDGVLTDTGTPLYVLPPRDTGRTLSEIPVSAYQNTPVPGGNGGSSPQFVLLRTSQSLVMQTASRLLRLWRTSTKSSKPLWTNTTEKTIEPGMHKEVA